MKLKSTLIRTVLIVLILLTVSTVMSFASRTPAQERKVTVPRSELPAAIRRAIEQAVDGDTIVVKIEKEVEGEDPGQYDVVIRSGEKDYEVEISPQGEVIEVKEVASADDEDSGAEQIKKWTDSFNLENCTFSTVGRNRFFSLEPGHQLVLQSDEEKVVITVLDKTKMIGGVRTRVIEEREEKDGQLAEVSRNFFAICKEHGDVFYFGEEVDDYKEGKVVGHGGAWRADEPDSKAGIIMPGTILLGARHYQEISPKAMDRAEIIADDVTMKTPAGTFKNCIRVEETSGLDPDERCYKTYAPGVGLIQDEDLLLVRYTKAEELGVERDRQARRRPEQERARRGTESLLARLEGLEAMVEELHEEIARSRAESRQSRSPREEPRREVSRELESRDRRAREERPRSEREVAMHQLEVMEMGLHALREANRADAAELLMRAIRAREMMLEGRRDEEAQAVRRRAPNREQLTEILSMAARLWRQFDRPDRAAEVGQLARQLAGRQQEPAVDRPERAGRERDVVRNQLEVMRYALHALAEAEKPDAADLLERAIHSRELALEGRRDEEAVRIRAGAPSRGAQIELLTIAEKILRELDQIERATAVGRLADQMRSREQR